MTTGNLSKSTEATIFSEMVLNPRVVTGGRPNHVNDLRILDLHTETANQFRERKYIHIYIRIQVCRDRDCT